jgi:hypothetical protein
VFTESIRNKLGSLIHKRSEPFFGANNTPFIGLGNYFVEAYIVFVNSSIATTN